MNPAIAFEFDDRMQTALHLAIKLAYFSLAEFLLKQACGRVLLSTLDIYG